MKVSKLGPQAISRVAFLSVMIALWVRNQNSLRQHTVGATCKATYCWRQYLSYPAAWTPRSGGGAGTSFSDALFCFWRICLICCWGVYKQWEVSQLSNHKVSRGMQSKSCLGTPWAWEVSIVVKHVLLRISFGVMTMVEKSSRDYIEWYPQNTKRMNLVSRYQHIMIFRHCDLMI